MQPGSGQILGAVRGLGSEWDSGRVLAGPAPRFASGLGLGCRAALCPDSTNRSLLNRLILYEPTCSKAQDAGMSQGLLSRSVEKGPYPVRLQPRCDN